MATDIEIDRALAVVASTLTDQDLDHFDASRVQQIVSAALAASRQSAPLIRGRPNRQQVAPHPYVNNRRRSPCALQERAAAATIR